MRIAPVNHAPLATIPPNFRFLGAGALSVAEEPPRAEEHDNGVPLFSIDGATLQRGLLAPHPDVVLQSGRGA